MPSDLPYILRCDWNFPPRVNLWWATCGVRRHETTPSLAALWLGTKKTKVLWHQSEARATAAVWNWSVKTLSEGALLAVLDFSSPEFFSRPFRLFPAPTNCPWVSEDGTVINVQADTRLKSLSSNECSRAWSSVFVDQYFNRTLALSQKLNRKRQELKTNVKS